MKFHPAFFISSVLGLSLIGVVFAQQRAAEHPAQFSARGTHGAIAAGSGYATEAAMRMYYTGGNAVDAGVASIFAAATTEYSHVGWGGEAPILIRTKDGKVHAIAGVGTMPKLATADFYRKRPLQVGEDSGAAGEGRSERDHPGGGDHGGAGAESCRNATLVALRDYGTKSFAKRLRRRSSLPTARRSTSSVRDRSRPAGSSSRSGRRSMKHFMPEGRAPLPGEIFHQPDLARSLRGMVEAEKKALAAGASRVAAIDAVRDYFYRGEIAKKIDEFSRANDGLLRYDDMAAFQPDAGRAGLDRFPRRARLQAGFLEPGSGHDRDAEYAERHRSDVDAA